METMMRDPLNTSPEASEQPYLRDREERLQSGKMTGEAAELMTRLREHFENSNEELAKALGVRRTTVDRWFAGETKPNGNSLMRAKRLAQMRGIMEEERSH